jgi:hypothetical protein
MGGIEASWFETRQRVRAKRGPMINSDALLTMRDFSGLRKAPAYRTNP